MVAAYEAYRRCEPGSLDALLMKVRKFAVLKTVHLEYNFEDFESAETVDDWSQNISFKVWQGLESFDKNPKSTPELFYSWVNRICFTEAADAFKETKKQRDTHVKLNGRKKNEDKDETYWTFTRTLFDVLRSSQQVAHRHPYLAERRNHRLLDMENAGFVAGYGRQAPKLQTDRRAV